MIDLDFNTAERVQSSLIPAGTQAPVIVAIQAGDPGTPDECLVRTKSGLLQLILECTITEGEHVKRKVWHRLTMGAARGVTMTEGQEKGVAISRAFLRSFVEAMRGISPTDDSPAAMEARKIESVMDLNGAEIWVEIGVEKDKTGEYGDKNKIAKILNPAAKGEGKAAGAAAAPAKPAPAKKASWA